MGLVEAGWLRTCEQKVKGKPCKRTYFTTLPPEAFAKGSRDACDEHLGIEEVARGG